MEALVTLVKKLRHPAAVLVAFLVASGAVARAGGQGLPGAGQPAAPAPAAAADAMGRATPRGTVLGFLNAARDGDDELARYYLNPKPGTNTAELAHELFVVLDVKLPARLTLISDAPDGSRANPLAPDEEVIGTIEGPEGPFEVVLERVRRPKSEPVWLFSSKTLEAIPAVFAEIERRRLQPVLPQFLRDHRIGNVKLYEWLAVLIALPLFYGITVLLNRALTPLVRIAWRRMTGVASPTIRSALPVPARLLLLSIATRWFLTTLPMSLIVRQGLSNATSVLTITAVIWLLMFLTAAVERTLIERIPPANYSTTRSLLRVGRRAIDGLIVFAGLMAVLRHFGFDPTPLVAGLGVGGIAVALAAQKTLENVIAGASLILDQAVRVGDYLRAGTIEGTVDHIGLRSTRIRTLDRTLVSVPNSQIASISLETVSARDKFWFHPIIGLRYETTTAQMQAVLDGIRQLLARQVVVEGASIRVRFLRLGAFSLDVEVFAYVFARDWAHFLEIQETLLLGISEIVTASGTGIAFPSQTMYVESAAALADAAQLPKSLTGDQEIRSLGGKGDG
jgi:MscS family membrane protein